MVEHTPDEMLAVADKLAKTIVKLRKACESHKSPLAVVLALVAWMSAVDSVRLGRVSPVSLTVPFVGLQLLLFHYAEDNWLESHGSHILKVGTILYLIVSEYMLGFRQWDSPTTAGVVFQHSPTYLALFCASNLREACISLGIYGALLLPLVDTWWRYNEFLLHCGLVCYAAWVKGKLFDLLDQSEALLNVRSMILGVSISRKEEQLACLGQIMEEKEKSNATLTRDVAKMQVKYQQMSDIAEEAVNMMGVTGPRQRGQAKA